MVTIAPESPLCLGSASPRRRELLGGLGLPLKVAPADVPEAVKPGEKPLAYLERIVLDKWNAVCRLAPSIGPYSGILVADTIVVIDHDVLGKPTDIADAERLLRRLVGREHTVYTRFAVGCDPNSPPGVEQTVATRVYLRAAAEQELRRYAATREGLDKAGAYAAQGIGSFLIEKVHGSYSNVVGLPVCEVVLALRQLGLVAEFP